LPETKLTCGIAPFVRAAQGLGRIACTIEVMDQSEKTIYEIKVGDTVCLREGGVPMRVLDVYVAGDGTRTADTEYWDGETNHRATHPCDALVPRAPYVEED